MSGFFFRACFAQAQQADAMFGFGTVVSPGAAACNVDATTGQVTCPEKGGLYTNIGADVIFHKRIGFAFDAAWRTSQGNYGGLGIPHRPIIFYFNGVYQPPFSKKVGLYLFGGLRRVGTPSFRLPPPFSFRQI